ncbi:MAG: class I tRNA ligase family protein, partial [Flavobacteriales bacterium]
LYYPLDSWFIRITQVRERMTELNRTIGWKPESTGTGRFGNWLENANDWNLSRSRFWGIPLPIWRTEDGGHEICIGSVAELKSEIERSIEEGIMHTNPLADFQPNDFSKNNYSRFDLHKPAVDDIVLVSPDGKPMRRESDLIDVWFDSGAMPYAQLHYPFENKELIDNNKAFPADYIAEGVDQTRGWFYTLHAIATMCFDSVAYKNVISNGLVLDKNGNKMSKRLGNAADPFVTIGKYGPDATRWYMLTNAQPWDNLKFDVEGIAEVQRKFFGTLFNTYGFFAIYANIDNYVYSEKLATPKKERTELDRWILSRLNHLMAEVKTQLDDYMPTMAARAIEEFVDVHLSNWYVRLSRKRFWHGEFSADKKAAYDTLFECLIHVAQLSSPFAPFFAEWLYLRLSEPVRTEGKSERWHHDSVHLTWLQAADVQAMDKALETRMDFAQRISSMILSIRKKESIRVRQPLQVVRIATAQETMQQDIRSVADIILNETNVKQLEFAGEDMKIVKQLKLNFKTLGKKCGKHMKSVQALAQKDGDAILQAIETSGQYLMQVEGESIELVAEDVEITPIDIPGWKVVNDAGLTVALDVNINEALHLEGLAREMVNRLQNLRKDSGLEVSDRLSVRIQASGLLGRAVDQI